MQRKDETKSDAITLTKFVFSPWFILYAIKMSIEDEIKEQAWQDDFLTFSVKCGWLEILLNYCFFSFSGTIIKLWTFCTEENYEKQKLLKVIQLQTINY